MDTSPSQPLPQFSDSPQVENVIVSGDPLLENSVLENSYMDSNPDPALEPASINAEQPEAGEPAVSANENAALAIDAPQPITVSVTDTPIDLATVTPVTVIAQLIAGTPVSDVLSGTGEADLINGDGGNDSLSGLGGNDTINGGDGDDFVIAVNRAPGLFSPQTNDIVNLDGGAGVDTVSVNLAQKTDSIRFDSTNPLPIQLLDGTRIANFEVLKDIATGSGSDRLIQLGAVNNQWFTGAGDDTVAPGLGTDTVDGGEGTDLLVLNYASVIGTFIGSDNSFRATDLQGVIVSQVNAVGFERFNIVGTANSDRFTVSLGETVIDGGAGDDTLTTGVGNDTLTGGLGNDVLNGGQGIDRVVEVGDINFTLTNTNLIGLGTDTLSNIESATLISGISDNVIDTTAFQLGSVTLDGGASNDRLSSGFGNDTLTGGLGDDVLSGGQGIDRLVESGDVNFLLTDTSLLGVGSDILSSIEQVTLSGGVGNNRLDASAFSGSAILSGGAGNDTLVGSANQGIFSSSQYASTVIAYSSQYGTSSWSAQQALGVPNTLYYGDSLNAWAPLYKDGTLEQLTLGFATPVFATGTTIRQNWGNGFIRKIEVLDVSNTFSTVWEGVDPTPPGAPADFTVSWAKTSLEAKGLRITIDTNHNLNTWEEIDAVQLHSVVPASGDTLSGGIGDDVLTGGLGDDTLNGGDGFDWLIESGDVNFSLTNSSLTGLGSDTLSGIERVALTGGAGDNVLTAAGFTGAVLLQGGAGNDQLIGGEHGDTLYGGDGDDNLTGDASSLLQDISAPAGINALYGDNGNDTLLGGRNVDALIGGAGTDLLTGGGGSDRFIFAAASDGTDTIFDLTAGVGGDVLVVRGLLSSLGYAGVTPFADGFLRLVDQPTGALLQVDADGLGTTADFSTLAILQNVVVSSLDLGSNFVV